LLLGFVLGNLVEETCSALIISHCDLMTFLNQPISAGLLTVALIILPILPTIRKGRDNVFAE